MSIVVDEETLTFSINTASSTYQMQVDNHGYLLHLYYGARTEGYMGYVLTYCDRGFSGTPQDVADRTYSLDVLPQEYPFQGMGDMRNPLFVVRDGQGAYGCDLRFNGYRVTPGKYALEGLPAVYAASEADRAETLSITLADERIGLEVELLYGVLPELDIITRAVVVRNTGDAQLVIKRLQTACLDFVHGDFDVISFFGRHAMERCLDRHRVTHGSFSIGSRRGSSSHQYNPMMILCDHDATEVSGKCWSMSFVYSGGFHASVEKDQFEQTRLQMGLTDESFSYPVEPGEELVAPEVIMSYANDGIEHLSQNLHRCISKHVCRGYWRDRVRPILINSWEAHYFDFTGDSLVELARKAAELDMDMLVMDDGWFGTRNSDTCALGDWYPNTKKLGGTVGDLARRVNELGLKFGLWVEPEMVSIDSDLYRAHPDWALDVPGKPSVLGRDQLVLDMTRADVRDNIFEQLCAVLDEANVEYLKWDFNRSIVDVFSRPARDQGQVLYDYVLGLYDLLERLCQRYPKLLIEGCAGGGGRFDVGMLYYTPQIWTSDNTDAVNRMAIQYGTSFGYPASAVGAHVSACPNEITGRTVPLDMRGIVAMAGGGFGYELDLLKLTDEECAEVRAQVAEYRKIAPLVLNGRYYRLSSPITDDLCAWEFVAEDGGEALVAVVLRDVDGYGVSSYVVPRGLTRGAMYRDVETGAVYPANALMDTGLPLSSMTAPFANHLFHFKRV